MRVGYRMNFPWPEYTIFVSYEGVLKLMNNKFRSVEIRDLYWPGIPGKLRSFYHIWELPVRQHHKIMVINPYHFLVAIAHYPTG